MKKFILIPAIILFTSMCAQSPVMSDMTQNRITLLLKGTYESNSPYEWEPTLYSDDYLSNFPAPVGSALAKSNTSLYIDLSDIRLAVGTGLPANTSPENYWVYFTKKREVICSDNYANGNKNYKLISCYNDGGELNFTEFFSKGTAYSATDVPVKTYNHMAIYFRKFTASPSIVYDSSYNPIEQTTSFDNRVIKGINLMDSIIQYAAADADKTKTLMFPLERKDLSLDIPAGNDSYVIEVRIFLKNLLMKHVIAHAGGVATAGAMTFVGPSDWKENHRSSDLTKSYQMGNNIIFTARLYNPATVGSLDITDNDPLPTFKSYYAVVHSGTTFDGTDLPLAATSRTALTASVGTTAVIDNLPGGTYDLYKTCDKNIRTASGLVAGQDGYPETVVSCAKSISITPGNTTTKYSSCACP